MVFILFEEASTPSPQAAWLDSVGTTGPTFDELSDCIMLDELAEKDPLLPDWSALVESKELNVSTPPRLKDLELSTLLNELETSTVFELATLSKLLND